MARISTTNNPAFGNVEAQTSKAYVPEEGEIFVEQGGTQPYAIVNGKIITIDNLSLPQQEGVNTNQQYIQIQKDLGLSGLKEYNLADVSSTFGDVPGQGIGQQMTYDQFKKAIAGLQVTPGVQLPDKSTIPTDQISAQQSSQPDPSNPFFGIPANKSAGMTREDAIAYWQGGTKPQSEQNQMGEKLGETQYINLVAQWRKAGMTNEEIEANYIYRDPNSKDIYLRGGNLSNPQDIIQNRKSNQPDATKNLVNQNQANMNQQAEVDKIDDEANKFMKEELSLIENETNKVDLSTSTDLVNRLIDMLDDYSDDTKETTSFKEQYAAERAKLGVGDLETELANLDAELAKLDADYASSQESEEGRKVSMAQIRKRQSAETVLYNRSRRDLVAERNSIATQLNNKYGVLSTMMDLAKMDYDVAQDEYNNKFNRTLQLTNLLQGIEESEKTEQTQKEDKARANLQVMMEVLQSSGKSYDDLDVSIQSQISQIELASGLPMGFTKLITETVDDPIVTMLGEYTNSQNQRVLPILTQNVDGSTSVKDVILGTVKATGSSGGGGGTVKTDAGGYPKGFWDSIDDGIKQLQKGEPWGVTFERISMQYPEVSDEDIDKALGTQWREEGAYEEWKQKQYKDNTSEWKSDEYIWQQIAEGEANNLDYATIKQWIKSQGKDPSDFGYY
jgi:hypothetical protein